MTVVKKNDLGDKFELHLDVSGDDMTAIDLLAEHTDFSRQKIKQIMQQGAIWLTQGNYTKRIRRASKKLKVGQNLHLYYNADILSQTHFKPELIADEKQYSVWFKPAGMLSQGSKYGDHCAIHRWAETHIQPQRNAFPVHRLDKATSGLILVAHSKKAAIALAKLFSEHSINKHYKALVHGTLAETTAIPLTIDEALDGRQAITRIQGVDSQKNNCSLLDIQILTGRKHQIRQHLANIGHPIVGDRLYGSGIKDKRDLCLTAYKISFLSPFDQQNKHYELGNAYYPDFSPNK